MSKTVIVLSVGIVLALGAGFLGMTDDPATRPATARSEKVDLTDASYEVATFATGCFWCTEADFEKLTGVVGAVSGYTGGEEPNPTYNQVSAGKTGHIEAVQVYYDPDFLNYEQLLRYFWQHVDPTDSEGQFVDRGAQYRPAIFYHDTSQKEAALASRDALLKSGVFEEPIVVAMLPLTFFTRAEDYHQDYYKTNSGHYHRYRSGSGRDQFLERTWTEENVKNYRSVTKAGRVYEIPQDEELREKLTPMQYKVTQNDGTEPPFKNEYWDNKAAGIYVDVVSGEPLFSSLDKFKSGTGWPSFTRALEPENVVSVEDRSLGIVRTELRSKHANSHLGHLFEDGPPPAGLRYCINSAALKFIPVDELEEKGYGEYLSLFNS